MRSAGVSRFPALTLHRRGQSSAAEGKIMDGDAADAGEVVDFLTAETR